MIQKLLYNLITEKNIELKYTKKQMERWKSRHDKIAKELKKLNKSIHENKSIHDMKINQYMKNCKWCPNSCGKSVYTFTSLPNIKKRYRCDRCNTMFTKEQLKKIN